MITNATQSTETNSQAQSISSHNNTSYLFAFGFFDVCSIFSPTFLACFFFFFLLFVFVWFWYYNPSSISSSAIHDTSRSDQLAIVHQFHLHSIHHLYNVISSRANTSGDHYASAGHHLDRPGAELQPCNLWTKRNCPVSLQPPNYPTAATREKEREREKEKCLEEIDMRLTGSRWRRL